MKIGNINLNEIDLSQYSTLVVAHPVFGWIVSMDFCQGCKAWHADWLVEVGIEEKGGLATVGYLHPDGKNRNEQFSLFYKDLVAAVGASYAERCTFHFVPDSMRDKAMSGELITPRDIAEVAHPPFETPTLSLIHLMQEVSSFRESKSNDRLN